MAAWDDRTTWHRAEKRQRRCVYCGSRCYAHVAGRFVCQAHRDLPALDRVVHVPAVDDGDNQP